MLPNRIDDDEIRLDPRMEEDLYEVAFGNTHVTIARNAFISMALDSPPEIQLASYKNTTQQHEFLRDIMAQYYLPFLHSMYDWIKMFGIYPWKRRRIPGTDQTRPWIPPFKSGYIATYLTRSHDQRYRWYWNDTNGRMNKGKMRSYDSSMQFSWKDERSKPGLDGRFRSDLASVLTEFKTEKIVRESTEIGVYHQARPQHVIEHHPAKNNQGDDNLTTLETFGESITGEVQLMQEHLRREKFQFRTEALKESIMTSVMRNAGYTRIFGHAESMADVHERMRAGQLDGAVTLEPDFSYKTAQMPKIGVDLSKISSRLDIVISSAMDFPLQMVRGNSGNSKANFMGQSQVLNRRIQDWIDFFKREVKRIFIELHHDDLLEGMDRVNTARIERGQNISMYVHDEIVVHIPTKTIASYEELQRMYENQLLGHEAFARHAGIIMGIPEEDLILTAPSSDHLGGGKVAGVVDTALPPKKKRKKEQKPKLKPDE